jgi:hypothetical protein
MQSVNPNNLILPPLDVAFVHFSHMLQSQDYHNYCKHHYPSLLWMPHCSTWAPLADIVPMESKSRAFWGSQSRLNFDEFGSWAEKPTQAGPFDAVRNLFKPKTPKLAIVEPTEGEAHGVVCGNAARVLPASAQGFNVCGCACILVFYVHSKLYFQFSYGRYPEKIDTTPSLRAGYNDSLQPLDLVQMVNDDSDWFENFVASQGGRIDDISADRWATFMVGYQRYLYLVAKYERKMEWIGFAPTPAIDLSKTVCYMLYCGVVVE